MLPTEIHPPFIKCVKDLFGVLNGYALVIKLGLLCRDGRC